MSIVNISKGNSYNRYSPHYQLLNSVKDFNAGSILSEEDKIIMHNDVNVLEKPFYRSGRVIGTHVNNITSKVCNTGYTLIDSVSVGNTYRDIRLLISYEGSSNPSFIIEVEGKVYHIERSDRLDIIIKHIRNTDIIIKLYTTSTVTVNNLNIRGVHTI